MTKEELQAIKVEKDGSSVTITGEIPFSYLEGHRAAALKYLGKNVEMDGFRKGHVPEAELTKHIGEMPLLSEMAERAMAEAYPLIIKEHELDVIGYPQISVTKLAAGNPLGFTATVGIMPKFSLPDYKAIAAKVNKDKASAEVTDEDVEKQIQDILRQKVAYERLQEKAAKKAAQDKAKEDMGDATVLPTPETLQNSDKQNLEGQAADKNHVHGEHCDHDHDHEELITEQEDFDKLPLPELTDELVKTLGQPGQFESVDDFKTKIREHLAIEKEREVTGAHRVKITDAIVDETKMDVPQVMIDAEIGQMFGQMEDDLRRAQLTMEGYLEHVKKTKEELAKEWAPSAEKRAKLQLILNDIAKTEELKPDPSMVDHEVSHLLEHHKDADEARVRIYVESVLLNEEVMKLLESA